MDLFIISIYGAGNLTSVEKVMSKQMNRRNMARTVVIGLAVVMLAGCEAGQGDVDRGFDSGLLEDGKANIWVDPDGCQHWYIDDGIEGYMTPRLNRDGTPKCQDTRGQVTMKDGSRVATEPEPMLPAS